MLNAETGSRRTRQGINFQDAVDVGAYAECFAVSRSVLCPKIDGKFETAFSYSASLFFVAGPNAGARGSRHGSMAMTLNRAAAADYIFFREAIKAAIASGLDAMILDGCTAAVVARISCGIYAGKHKQQIEGEIETLVQEILWEPPGTCGGGGGGGGGGVRGSLMQGSTIRGAFFSTVIIADVL